MNVADQLQRDSERSVSSITRLLLDLASDEVLWTDLRQLIGPLRTWFNLLFTFCFGGERVVTP